jgi:class 3 adenylate cyclase
MTEDLKLHQHQSNAALNRSIFRPHFTDPNLEATWKAERLIPFRKVNRRALWVIIFASMAFVFVDLAFVGSGFKIIAMRTIFIVYSILFLVGVNKVKTIQQGDVLVLTAGLGAIAFVWFNIFLKLPMEMVGLYWMATSSLIIIVWFVLVETMLLVRLIQVLIWLILTLAAPIYLGLAFENIFISYMHIALIGIVGWVAAWQVEIAKRISFARQREVELERSKTVSLLRNILPVPIADRLLSEPGTIAERHSNVTVLFADIVGFTPWASSCKPDKVVEVLDQIFSAFDLLCEEHDVEKIKTIGDAYMAASGVPEGGGGVEQVVRLALSMMNVIAEVPIQGGTELQLRIGLHQGPVVAGVIGRKKFIYDLWGDTVNLAARMESHGVPGRVQVTERIANQLGEQFLVEPRGIIEVKGKGKINAYLVSLAE